MQNLTYTPFLNTIDFGKFNGFFDGTLDNIDANENKIDLPYDIEEYDDDKYIITIAVAGFCLEDLNIVTEKNQLTVSGKTKNKEDKNTKYLHKGIFVLDFENKFNLSEHVKVKGANLDNGILKINLVRKIPEAAKPKIVEIKLGETSDITETKKLKN